MTEMSQRKEKPSFTHNLLQQCLILWKKLVHLAFLRAILTESVFSLTYFLTQLNA